MLKKILVANRGEIALRVIRACRELAIESVAVYSDADRTALHVRAASEAHRIGPPPATESYLNGQAIIEVALRSGAEAIHPGYGFLSENAAFAQAVEDAGLCFIGPRADQIRKMGDKVEARRLMKAAGVPVVPGTEEVIEDPEVLGRTARALGLPVMIKAAGGGGGKGIRIVHSEAELHSAFERARSEALSSFKNASVYLEKYLEQPRHIEFQVLADNHGQTIHLGERECSIQRRHQKILEESPSPVMTPELRRRMGEAAVAAAQAVGYRNAGTIEFLVDQDSNFYFLEMNTRLQVEHPVTETVTGIDLVREQIAIAGGAPLGLDQEQVALRGHSIEARIYAEDPSHDFAPSIGRIRSLDLPGGSRVRLDSAMYRGMEVSLHYDPMLAKLIIRGNDRDESLRRLHRALTEFKVTGVQTNIPYLLAVCATEAFRAGRYHTGYLEEHKDEIQAGLSSWSPEHLAVIGCVLRYLLAQRVSPAPDAGVRDPALDGWALAGRFERLGL
ncbi:MAG: acetyl-CoA carboxylase biotin carboxylase subunit [Planctomycetota bacterium]